MENYCMVASKYHEENAEEAYSCDTSVHSENPSYADDAHYFDIDISIPFSPADAIPISSSNDDDTEDEFELDLSIYTAPPPSPNLCCSPASNLFYQSQFLPLQLLTPPLDDINIDIAFPQSRDVPGVRFQYPNLIEIADRNKKGAKEMIQNYLKKISQRGYDEKIRYGDLEKPRIAKGHKICCCRGSQRSVKQISFSRFSGNLSMAYRNLDKGKQPPYEMQRKLPDYSSYSTWMEVQSAIEGAIAYCKQTNYSH